MLGVLASHISNYSSSFQIRLGSNGSSSQRLSFSFGRKSPVREALARILSKKNNITVIGAASYSSNIESVLASIAPDVLLFDPLDWNLCLALIRHLRDSMPNLKIVMIGMDADGELFLRAVREGVGDIC